MVVGALRQALPVRDTARQNPEANVPHVDLKWWLLSHFDSALVSSADGTEASWYKRDREQFASLMKRSIALHARLAAEWPQLVEQYKTALPELASPDAWHETFVTSQQPKGS
jgi:galactofuranosylgalactofuranosylrhamnosyl-N-acetylglucosaminyl-diphospho-decaprenol beta-1,5/1,6-galactofuranosyltransferase